MGEKAEMRKGVARSSFMGGVLGALMWTANMTCWGEGALCGLPLSGAPRSCVDRFGPGEKATDLWVLPEGEESMSPFRPSFGLDTTFRGPPGGTPNMTTYNRP